MQNRRSLLLGLAVLCVVGSAAVLIARNTTVFAERLHAGPGELVSAASVTQRTPVQPEHGQVRMNEFTLSTFAPTNTKPLGRNL